jgi:DNA recombination protein RmuC
VDSSLALAAAAVGALVAGCLLGGGAMLVVHRRILALEVSRASSLATAAAVARANGEIALLRDALARHETEATLTERHGNVAELLGPIRDTLTRYDDVLRQMGRSQAQSAGAIGQRLDAVALAGEALRKETQTLANALRSPNVRGQWGELQLRRVCELAGMLAHCDFETQTSVRGDDGMQRPDLVVRLPGGRRLVVDAKAPMAAYLDATSATDDGIRAARMHEHAASLRGHVGRLAAKRYWSQFTDAPEFVVLFLPGEAFFAAALEADPSLLECAMGERVLIATPTTLIALLKAASYGWRQENVAVDAARIVALGRELQERLGTFDEQLSEVGRGLQRAVQSYNRAVGSLESRVLVSARRLGSTGGTESPLDAPPLVDTAVRNVDALLS